MTPEESLSFLLSLLLHFSTNPLTSVLVPFLMKKKKKRQPIIQTKVILRNTIPFQKHLVDPFQISLIFLVRISRSTIPVEVLLK